MRIAFEETVIRTTTAKKTTPNTPCDPTVFSQVVKVKQALTFYFALSSLLLFVSVASLLSTSIKSSFEYTQCSRWDSENFANFFFHFFFIIQVQFKWPKIEFWLRFLQIPFFFTFGSWTLKKNDRRDFQFNHHNQNECFLVICFYKGKFPRHPVHLLNYSIDHRSQIQSSRLRQY